MHMQPEKFKMETNFDGLIKLLAGHLYLCTSGLGQ
jgi:hypothetical protein